MGKPLRRARAAPSARFGYLIRARQRAGLQGGRCGKERTAEVGSGDPWDRSAGGDLLPPNCDASGDSITVFPPPTQAKREPHVWPLAGNKAQWL